MPSQETWTTMHAFWGLITEPSRFRCLSRASGSSGSEPVSPPSSFPQCPNHVVNSLHITHEFEQSSPRPPAMDLSNWNAVENSRYLYGLASAVVFLYTLWILVHSGPRRSTVSAVLRSVHSGS